MGAGLDIGALLGGAAEEAQNMRKERLDQENANFKFAHDTYQHLIDNENAPPDIRNQAQQAQLDALMQHLGYATKGPTSKNPIKSMVEKMVGSQPNTYNIPQFGVGSGNAKTQLGGIGPAPTNPQSPDQPSGPPTMDQGGSSDQGAGVPNAPTKFFYNPDEVNSMNAKKLASDETAKINAKIAAWEEYAKSPDMQELKKTNRAQYDLERKQAIWGSSIAAGASLEAKANPALATSAKDARKVYGDTVPAGFEDGDTIAPVMQNGKVVDWVLSKKGNTKSAGITSVAQLLLHPDMTPDLRDKLLKVTDGLDPATVYVNPHVDADGKFTGTFASVVAPRAQQDTENVQDQIRYLPRPDGSFDEIHFQTRTKHNVVPPVPSNIGQSGTPPPSPAPPNASAALTAQPAPQVSGTTTNQVLPPMTKPLDVKEAASAHAQRGQLILLTKRLDNVYRHAAMFDDMINAGKYELSLSQSGIPKLAARGINLTDEEKDVLGDFNNLSEQINGLRGPTGATGFRSEAAYTTLQGMKGNLLGNPQILRRTLQNTLEDALVQIGSHTQALNHTAPDIRKDFGFPESSMTDIAHAYIDVYGNDPKVRAQKRKEHGLQ